MTTRQDRDRRQRERVLQAVLEIVENGDVDMRSVAARANLSISTLYRHFGSKDGLLEETLRGLLETWRSTVAAFLREHRDDDPADVLCDFYLLIIRSKREDPETHLHFWAQQTPQGQRVMEEIKTIHGEVVYDLLRAQGVELGRDLAELVLPGYSAMLERVSAAQALLRKPQSDRLIACRLANGVIAASRGMLSTSHPPGRLHTAMTEG